TRRKPVVNQRNLRARLWCESLEDRLVPATSIDPTHVYELNGSLADQLGGPALVADGGTLDSSRFTYTANEGLTLTGALADTANYSIVMTMEADSLSPFFQKILDFAERTSDDGLYLADGALQLYPGDAGADAVGTNTDFQLVLTRNKDTGE